LGVGKTSKLKIGLTSGDYFCKSQEGNFIFESRFIDEYPKDLLLLIGTLTAIAINFIEQLLIG